MYEYVGTVVRVVDGDTIDIKVELGFYCSAKIRFRLVNLDTPEVRGPEKEHGLRYKRFVQEYLPKGAPVFVVSLKTGKYGRWLGKIWKRDGGIRAQRSLNEMLIHMLANDPHLE